VNKNTIFLKTMSLQFRISTDPSPVHSTVYGGFVLEMHYAHTLYATDFLWEKMEGHKIERGQILITTQMSST
jgi:hypothetical protein